MSGNEKRRHPRLPIFSAALITCAGKGWLSEVRDLSRGGARLARPRDWDDTVEHACRVYFILDQDTVLALDVRCVRDGLADLGVAFVDGQQAEIDALLYESRFLEGE